MKRILIVEDDASIVATMTEMFEIKGFRVMSAYNEEQALKKVDEFKPDIMLLDMDLMGDGKDRTGREILLKIRKRWNNKELPVIVISGVGDVKLLNELMQKGMDDYEVKPLEFQDLLMKINRFIKRKDMPEKTRDETWTEEVVGKSKVIMNLSMNIWRSAQAESDTLILGETGTGKNLIARAYHRLSRRCDNNFYEIDCTNIVPTLFEAEIFGYVQGAFSEAKGNKRGRIEEADGGIALFNEIGDLPWEQQAKLLALLESKTITRVGSNKPIKLDIVILAATNRDLYAMVKQGLFRKDLYYRLYNNLLISPPLRDHLEDIPCLLEYFKKEYNEFFNKQINGFDPDLVGRLQEMPWEGNVRQLKKCVSFGVQHCLDDTITMEDVSPFLRNFNDKEMRAEPFRLDDFNPDMSYQDLKALEKDIIQKIHKKYLVYALNKFQGNVSRTARHIGIKREYLNQIIKHYHIQK